MRALVVAWALGATVLALLWLPRGGSPTPRTSTAAEVPRLRRRIAELEDALAHVVPPPVAAPVATPSRAEDLFAAVRRLSDDPEATTQALQDAGRALQALLARDADAHAVLARMLPDADEETADQILAALVWNPFAKAVRKRDVTDEITAIASSCLQAQEPHVRAAAATLLLGYASPPEPPHVRLAMDALVAETVPSVRDAMLEAVADRARGVALTETEARPLVEELRRRAALGETSWLCALADWSDSGEDYARAESLFRAQRETGTRQECLNAFRREARLVEGRVALAEDLLRRVMLDPSLDDMTRGLARHFLDGYAPWGLETADAVRRFEDLRR